MKENIYIPIILNGRTCKICVSRTLFSNDDDQVTIVWYGDDGEEIEHCYASDLSQVELQVVNSQIEEFDREQVKKSL